MTPRHRTQLLRSLFTVAALCLPAALASADAATPSAATGSAAPVSTWQEIAQRIAGFGLVVPAGREIQPDLQSSDDHTRALEFRGAMPNPFHAETAIRFTLPTSARVSLRVYDVAGKLVRTLVDAQLPPGDHSALLTARDLRSGVYFAVLRTGAVQVSHSVILAR